MKKKRFRFSLRTVLVLIVLTSFAGFVILRFGNHISWTVFHSDGSTKLEPIPIHELEEPICDFEIVTCSIGPVSFQIPKSMTQTIDASSDYPNVLLFDDGGGRQLMFSIPFRETTPILQEQFSQFPDFSDLSTPRIFKVLAETSSNDFSFFMTNEELNLHKRLYTMRRQVLSETSRLDYAWKTDIDVVVLFLPNSGVSDFRWSTTDKKWEGKITFLTQSNDYDLIRLVCSTFSINGDLKVFDDTNSITVKTWLKLSD